MIKRRSHLKPQEKKHGWVRIPLGCLALATSPLAAQTTEWLEGDPRVRVHETSSESPAGAIVLIHDWFGMTEMTFSAAQVLAAGGYHVVAVDLYDGEVADNGQAATALMNSLNQDQVRAKVVRAVDRVPSDLPVVTIGFSMGGAVAVRAAAWSPRVIASISVYGGGIEGALAGVTESDPVLLVTGSADNWAMTSARALIDLAENVPIELKIFPGAGHGYAQPLFAGGANLDSAATEETWHTILAFLASSRRSWHSWLIQGLEDKTPWRRR